VEKIPIVRDKARIDCAVAQIDAIFTQVGSAISDTAADAGPSAPIGAVTTSADKMRTISLFEKTHRTLHHST